MALTDISHPTDIAMLTDLYELTMAQGLWESGKANEQGCFTAFYRDHPFGSAYAVMCGTAELPELVENLRFTPEDIDYLASLQAPAGGAMFKPAFLDYLRNFRAHVNIDAVPEGELVFPREPMVRVTGPALECQLLETALLNIVGFQTLVATKTARVVLAADGRPVAEFGLRPRIMKLFKRHPMFVFGLFALFAYEIAEISINSYFINFVTGQGWMNDNTASIVLTMALGFFMVGRFLGSWIMRKVRAELMLLYCGIGSVVCIGLVLLDFGKCSMIALVCNYLFEAIMFPTIFTLALQGLGNLTKSASSLLMMTPIGGCFFLLMGYVADQTNLVLPFIIPFIGYFVVLLFASELTRKHKQSEE